MNSAEFIDNFALLDALSEENGKFPTITKTQIKRAIPLDTDSEENYPTARDNVKYATMSETQSDLVPPLDIRSEDNYPTTRDYTFSYRKHCQADKIALKPDKAFETWLSAKRYACDICKQNQFVFCGRLK